MVVRLDLENDIVFFVESHDSRVVFKDAHAPILVAELASDRLGCCKDRFLEHVFELATSVFILVGDAAGKRLVAAMLAPCLCDRL